MATEMMSSSAAAADAAAAASTQKMSRYRSVRRAQEQQQTRQPTHASQHDQPSHPNPRMPAVPDSPPQNEAPLSRSMSRYHRRPVTSHATSPQPPLQRFNPESDDSEPPLPQSPPSASRYRNPGSPYQSTHTANTAQRRPRSSNNRGEASPPASDAPRQLSLRSDNSAREILEKEKERQRQLREKYEAEARAKRQARQAELDRAEKQRQEEEEAARLRQQREAQEAEALRRQREEQKTEHERGRRLQKAEPRKVSQQKEERQRRAPSAKPEDRAPKAPLTSPTVSPPRQQDVGVGMFKRRKDDVLGLDAPVQFSAAPQLSLNFDSHADETIRPGGGGVVRNIDAPTSAVNAGDRRVTVVCNKKRILLPVTPTTTPLDLIKSASTVLTDPIDIRTAVISEYFTKVSITRPLRNYEYVRDVMNSWDHDNQNELTIIDSDVDGINQDDLLAYKVPETRPEGMSCYIQYSSRPGKWSKRLLTLRPDGQLVMAKNEKTKEKDLENILTLTDYDIYTVTQQKLAKVRPPKKICYAVKSMQKSNIFADESQYVHFFCTNDRNTANLFYSSLQTWRSWYLKHQKGEGQKKKSPAQRNITAEAQPTSGHSRGESVGSHYQLGAFSSLLDMDSFNKKLDEIEVHRPGEFPDDKPLSKLDSRAINTRKKSVRTKNPPPTAMGRSASCKPSGSQPMSRQTSAQRSSDGKDDEEFASGGLLGRGYTERQAAAQAREQQAVIQAREPFMEGPSLLNNIGRLGPPMNDSGVKRSTSVRSNHHRRTSSDLQRSASKRVPGMPEPLVDLTPTYRPPPQHLNKGKGFNPGAGAGPLVESATSIEEAIKIPSLYRPPPQHLNKGKGYNPGTSAGPLVESATSIEEAIKIPSTYRPPPQHLNKGKGFNPGAGAGPLVESATSIEEAIKIPSSTDWRAGRPGTSRAAGIDRTRSLKGRGEPLAAHTKNNHGGIPEDASKAFTGGGLVSQAGYSLGKDNVGRGVMDFSKAKGPMVNLATNGEFAQGSLLSGLPVTPPIIDRSGED